MSGDKVLIGQNVAAGIAAMRDGVRSPAWEYYMTQFARDDDGSLDKAKLARLMGSDGTLGDPIMDRKRAYLVANSICGDTTYNFMDYGCDSIDDGINGAVCDRFLSPCIGDQSGGNQAVQTRGVRNATKAASKETAE